MNLKDIHIDVKKVSAKSISNKTKGEVISIQIMENGVLKEHVTKTPAILICVVGKVMYEDEKETREVLKAGDFYEITPMVPHWVKGIENSQVVLIK